MRHNIWTIDNFFFFLTNQSKSIAIEHWVDFSYFFFLSNIFLYFFASMASNFTHFTWKPIEQKIYKINSDWVIAQAGLISLDKERSNRKLKPGSGHGTEWLILLQNTTNTGSSDGERQNWFSITGLFRSTPTSVLWPHKISNQ